MRNRILTAAVGLLLTAPLAGRGADPTLLVGGAANQTAPSVWGSYLAYLDDSSGVGKVHVKHLVTQRVDPVAADDFAHGGPDMYRTYVAYRVPDAVKVFDAYALVPFRSVSAPGTGRIAMAANFVAWDQAAADGGDVAWQRFLDVAPVVLARPGRQHSVAAAVDWLAYIDDAAGTVQLVDTNVATERVVFRGAPLEVSIWTPEAGVEPVLAVTISGARGTEIVVVDASGTELAHLASLPGEKVNPHLSEHWIGFEYVERDLAGAVVSSQVTLWNWVEPRLFTPAPLGSRQMLHDLAASPDSLVVVWADDSGGDYDIFQIRTSLPIVEPPPPGPTPARCDDPAATVLADFTVQRAATPADCRDDDGDHDDGDHDDGDHDDGDHDDGDHDDGDHDDGDHDDGDHDERKDDPRDRKECRPDHRVGRPAAGGARFEVLTPTPVLVCIDATGVSSAWVAAGSQVVASPADFDGSVAALEGRLLLDAGDGRAGAVVAGGPGASLRVRVLADPGGNGNGSTDGSTCLARGDCPAPGRRLERAAHFGCGTEGAGPIALLLLAGLVAVGPARRRARR